MWVLRHDRKPEVAYALLPGQSYSVGRGQAVNISMPADTSISRTHARINVSQADTTARPRVTLVDHGSTFGTYLGEKAIASSEESSQDDKVTPKEPHEMTDGVRVRFGLLSTIYKLQWRPPILVTTSALQRQARDQLKHTLSQIGGANVTNAWSDEVTHVSMMETILTIKAVNALAKGIPIVTPEFFRDLVECTRTKQRLPDPANFVPRLNEQSLEKTDISCTVITSRSVLFKGKTFIFASDKQKDKYDAAIRYSGGNSICLTGNRRSYAADVASSPNFVLIHPPKDLEEIGESFKCAQAGQQKKGWSLIPEQNIGIAILKNSCEPDCNPERKLPNIVAGAIAAASAGDQNDSPQELASPTQSVTQSVVPLTATEATNRVPETNCTGKMTKSSSSRIVKEEDSGELSFTMTRHGKDTQEITVKTELESPQPSNSLLKRPLREDTAMFKRPAKKLKLEKSISQQNEADKSIMNFGMDSDNDEELADFDTNRLPQKSLQRLQEKSPQKSTPPPKKNPNCDRQNELPKQNNESPDGNGDQIDVDVNPGRRSPRKTPTASTGSTARGSKRSRQDSENVSPVSASVTSPKRGSKRICTDRRSPMKINSIEDEKVNLPEGSKSSFQMDDGFLVKAMIKELTISTINQNAESADLSRSYVQLQVTSLVKSQRSTPCHQGSTGSGDHSKTLPNFKVFKKQNVHVPNQQVVSVPLSQVATNSNTAPGRQNNSFFDEWTNRDDAVERSADKSDDSDEEREDNLWHFQNFQGSRNGRSRGRKK